MSKTTTTGTGAKYRAMKVSWDQLVINPDNARKADNLDTESIVPQLLSAGRVTDPLSVEPHPKEKDKYIVLRGNRRTSGVQFIMRGAFTPEQKAGFEKIDVQVYTDLSEKEREDMIFDQGGFKPLSREETALAVERKMKQGYGFGAIVDSMYYQLAHFTGQHKKLAAVPKNDPVAREMYLKKWFRGSLDQYIMYGFQMGPWVREQFLLTLKAVDTGNKLKPEDGRLWMNIDRDVMKALWAAMIADEKIDEGGKGWKVYKQYLPPEKEGDMPKHVGGGENFNTEVEKWVRITLKQEKKRPSSNKPSTDDLEKLCRTFAGSPEMTAVARFAMGAEGAGEEMERLFKASERTQNVFQILRDFAPKLKNEKVKELVNAILDDGPSGDVEVALTPFVK